MNVASGKTYLFVAKDPEAFAIWKGKITPPEHYEKEWGFEKCSYHGEYNPCIWNETDQNDLAEWAKGKDLYVLRGTNSDSNLKIKEPEFQGIDKAKSVNRDILFEILSECRVFKSDEELDLMRHINKVSSDAHIAVIKKIQPGMYESEMESLFLHRVYSRGGCRFVSYNCICATGENNAVLHYPYNDKEMKDGAMCLYDMGGEYNCYASDITCSFPVNGKFTSDQAMIYNIVLDSQLAVFKAMKPGVSFVDMHRLSERVIVTGLRDNGILKGDVDEMKKHFIGSYFMCHGLGHFLGIDTHDVGGYPENGPKRIQEPGVKNLRTSRILQPRMVITVEPGLYFNRILLKQAKNNDKISHFFNWDVIERFMDFGGVRIEDNVIITEDGIENMTMCPRTVEELEKTARGEEIKEFVHPKIWKNV